MVEWIFLYVSHCTGEDITRKQTLPAQEQRKIDSPTNIIPRAVNCPEEGDSA